MMKKLNAFSLNVSTTHRMAVHHFMKPYAKMGMWAVIALLLFSGCATQRGAGRSSGALPDEIYLAPDTNDTRRARVGVFAFSGPAYAPEMGPVASEILCDELEKSRVFREVISQPDILDMTLGNLVKVGRVKRFDLIITGRLLNYFEGTDLESSRVSEEIRVISVRGGKPRVLWHAKASEIASPVRSKDFIFFLSDGRPAASPVTLMRKNAEKFCEMLLTVPEQR